MENEDVERKRDLTRAFNVRCGNLLHCECQTSITLAYLNGRCIMMKRTITRSEIIGDNDNLLLFRRPCELPTGKNQKLRCLQWLDGLLKDYQREAA